MMNQVQSGIRYVLRRYFLSKKPVVAAQKNQNKGLFCHLRGCFEIGGKNRRVFDKILRGVFSTLPTVFVLKTIRLQRSNSEFLVFNFI
jgi:hypothetical protein